MTSHFFISLLVPLKIAKFATEITLKKFGTFLNLFHPEIKWLIGRFTWMKIIKGYEEVPVQFNQIVMMVRVFANGQGIRVSIPDLVMPNTQKMVLDAAFLNTQRYKVQIKCNLSNPWKAVVLSLTNLCCRLKGSLQVTFNYICHLIYINISD